MTGLDLQHARAATDAMLIERARLEIALARLFAVSGSFAAMAATAHNCLRQLAARVRDEGGDLGGWVA